MFIKSKKSSDESQYKEYQNSLNKIKRASRQQYYVTECCEFCNDSKKVWTIINKLIGKTNDKTNVIEKITSQGRLVYDNTSIAEEFVSYFANIGEYYANKTQESEHSIKFYLGLIQRIEKSLFFFPTMQIEIDRTIRKLKSKTSYGLDGISNKLLKELRLDCWNPCL